MLLLTPAANAVRSELHLLGFEQLQALGAVPVNNPMGIRYPLITTARKDGSQWYLRSLGTDFDLVNPEDRRFHGRWFSTGWGIVAGKSVESLLLIHVSGCTRKESEMLVHEIRRIMERIPGAHASPISIAVGTGFARMCAVLDPPAC